MPLPIISAGPYWDKPRALFELLVVEITVTPHCSHLCDTADEQHGASHTKRPWLDTCNNSYRTPWDESKSLQIWIRRDRVPIPWGSRKAETCVSSLVLLASTPDPIPPPLLDPNNSHNEGNWVTQFQYREPDLEHSVRTTHTSNFHDRERGSWSHYS